MQAKRFIETVGNDGFVHLDVGKKIGTRVEIIVLEITDSVPDESFAAAKVQAETGFVKDVLANKKEDIWNDL